LKKLVVEAPASSANLGPGFDVFALALEAPRDRLSITAERTKGLDVEVELAGGLPVPLGERSNVAAVVARAIAKDFKLCARIKLSLKKGVPLGVGLGSSGASSAASAVAMNELFALGMAPSDLIYYAGKGEEAVAGTAHYDNVAASILGGFVIVRESVKPGTITFSAPSSLRLCLATPRVSLPERKTEYARRILLKSVRLKKLVSNVAKASFVVAGFAKGDIGLVGEGMDDDIVEPVRGRLIPGYHKVREAAVEAGASGACISGAGPTILALVDGVKRDPKEVLAAMLSAFRASGTEASGFITGVGGGARRIEG
jgi:homoserine kinase